MSSTLSGIFVALHLSAFSFVGYCIIPLALTLTLLHLLLLIFPFDFSLLFIYIFNHSSPYWFTFIFQTIRAV